MHVGSYFSVGCKMHVSGISDSHWVCVIIAFCATLRVKYLVSITRNARSGVVLVSRMLAMNELHDCRSLSTDGYRAR